MDKKIRLAIAGLGNCAWSLIQGLEYYKNVADDAQIQGLMHANLGGYRIKDIELVAAFDVDANKVGKDVKESKTKPVDVAAVLKRTKADVLVSYLPVGSELGVKYYAMEALKAKTAFI